VLSSEPLRLTTWLAPSLPLPLFQALADRIGQWTGRPVQLTSDTVWSGPRPWLHDPFESGEVDVGFLCAPSWAWLAARPAPSIVAVPALPVPLDARARGRPVYFSDVIVPRDGAPSFEALRGGRWAYNDPCSLSGWFALKARVGDVSAYFREVVQSGSHLASIRLVAEGAVDAAAIDSTVLSWVLAAEPALREQIRIVASWGPHPIQPVVARAGLGQPALAHIASALRSFDPAEGGRSALASFGVAGFVGGEPEPVPEELMRTFAQEGGRSWTSQEMAPAGS
jgi:phosphonate transport system substrate-binding protein